MKLLQAATVCITYLSLTAHAYPSSSLSTRNNDKKIPDLLTVTLDELSDGLSKGHFTSVQLVEAYLARINETQPILRAVIETNPYALEEAAMYDSMRKDGKAKDKGPLFGVPILIKDNIATARPDQTYMNTTAGSFALVGRVNLEQQSERS
jgi:amidase